MRFFLFAGLSLVGAQTQKVPFPGPRASSEVRPTVDVTIFEDAQSDESDEAPMLGESMGTDYDYDVTVPSVGGSLLGESMGTDYDYDVTVPSVGGSLLQSTDDDYDDYDYDYVYGYDYSSNVSSSSPLVSGLSLSSLFQMAFPSKSSKSSKHHHSHSHHSSQPAIGLFNLLLSQLSQQRALTSSYDYDYDDVMPQSAAMNMLFVVPSVPQPPQRPPIGLFTLAVHNFPPQPQPSQPRMQQTFFIPPSNTQTTYVPSRTQTTYVPPRTQTVFVPYTQPNPARVPMTPPVQTVTTSNQSSQTSNQSSQATGQSEQTTEQTTNQSSQTVSQAPAPTPEPVTEPAPTSSTPQTAQPQTTVEVAPQDKKLEIASNSRASKQAKPDVVSYRSAP